MDVGHYIVEIRSDIKGPSLNSKPILYELKDVFARELKGLHTQTEINFMIELQLDTNNISKTRYRPKTLYILELQI